MFMRVPRGHRGKAVARSAAREQGQGSLMRSAKAQPSSDCKERQSVWKSH